MLFRSTISIISPTPNKICPIPAISGIAGIGHILLGVGLIILMVILLKLSEKENEHESNSVI